MGQSCWGKAGVKVKMEDEVGVKDDMGDSRGGKGVEVVAKVYVGKVENKVEVMDDMGQ